MHEIDMLNTEWLSYLLETCPSAYINMHCGRLKRWIGSKWKDVEGGKKNCKQLYLSSAENRVHIETKGAFYGETIFCVRYQYVDTRHYIEKRLM